MSPSGETAHGLVVFAVLREADWNIGSIGRLQPVRVLLSEAHDDEDQFERQYCYTVDRDRERLVRTIKHIFEVLVERLLCRTCTRLFVQGERERINIGNF